MNNTTNDLRALSASDLFGGVRRSCGDGERDASANMTDDPRAVASSSFVQPLFTHDHRKSAKTALQAHRVGREATNGRSAIPKRLPSRQAGAGGLRHNKNANKARRSRALPR